MASRCWSVCQKERVCAMVRLGLLYWPTPTTVYNAIANNSIDPSLRELIAELDGFPLVLSDAGAYLRKFPITCADYLKMYRESWLRLQTSIPRHLDDKGLHLILDSLFPRIEQQNVNSARLSSFGPISTARTSGLS
jgi:hypothetical protein